MLQARDDEQQLLIDEAQFEARQLVSENLDLLGHIAELLLAKETLDRAEIEQIMAGEARLVERPEPETEPVVVGLTSLDAQESVAPPANGRANGRSVAPPLNGRKPSVERA
jgi:hypothetical protein